MIADGNGIAVAKHTKALKFQRGLVFQRVKIAPFRMKFPCHSHAVQSKSSGITSRHGKMQVSPFAGGKAFQLEMGVCVPAGTGARPHMSGIIKDSTVRILLSHQRGHFFFEPVNREFSKFPNLIRIRGIDSPSLHFGAAGRAGAGTDSYNIEKDSIQLFSQQLAHLFRVGCQKIVISGVNAQRLAKARFCKGDSLVSASWLSDQPLGMGLRGMIIPLNRDIYRRLDTGIVQRPHLLQKQIVVFQIGMN